MPPIWCCPRQYDGFTIQNGRSINGGGILAEYSSLIIANNTIQNNTATRSKSNVLGGGVYARSCYMVLSNNLIQGNFSSSGGGVALYYDTSDLVVRNTFKSNTAAYYSGIYMPKGGGGLFVVDSKSGKYLNNVFISNVYTNLYGPQHVDASASGGGCYISGSASEDGDTNEIRNNTFIGNWAYYCTQSGGLALSGCKNMRCANNLVAYNSSGILVQSCTNIQWLNNCVFSNLNSGYSGIADQTGTNANISVNASFALPLKPYLLSNSPCIDAGMTIPGAFDELDWAGNPRLLGNAVDIGAIEYSSAYPLPDRPIYFVSSNGSDGNSGQSWQEAKQTVQAGINAAAVDGGEVWVKAGKYIENLNLLPFVGLYGGFNGSETSRNQRSWNINPTILDGGGTGTVVRIISSMDQSAVSGFTIQNGGAPYSGGGIYCESSWPTISENQILFHNPGPGLYCNASAALVYNNVFAFNTNTNRVMGGSDDCGTSGITLYSSPRTKIINNTVVSNYVARPSSYQAVHGAIYSSREGIFVNNIIAFNNDSGIQIVSTVWPRPALNNNCFFGNVLSNYYRTFPGTNDTYLDPQFIPDTFQLSANSPCMDAGDDSVIMPDTLDLAGTSRIQGAHVDIGAFEYAPAGEWSDFVPGTECLQITPVTVGGITYIPWRFEFAESRYRMAEPETATTDGTNITCRFNIEQWTGTEKPGTNAFSGTFVLGALNPGDYAFAVNVSSNEFKTVPFSVPTERTPTLTWQPRTEGALKLQVAGVADVTYRLFCATNLVDWTILSTHRGAPFELDVTNNPDIPTLFYRVEIVK